MGLELGDLVKEIREASANLDQRDAETVRRFGTQEKSVNEIFLKANRPGWSGGGSVDDLERNAIEYCQVKHELATPKNDDIAPAYAPSSAEIDNAMLAKRALRSVFRHGNADRLDVTEKKSLTSFSFGSNEFVLPPQMSDRVLTCLIDPTGLMGQASTSGGSLKFFVDTREWRMPVGPVIVPASRTIRLRICRTALARWR